MCISNNLYSLVRRILGADGAAPSISPARRSGQQGLRHLSGLSLAHIAPRGRSTYLACIVLVILAGLSGLAAAEDVPELVDVRQRIESHSQELEGIKTRESALQSELERLEQEIAALRAREAELTGELRLSEVQRNNLVAEIESNDQKIRKLEILSRERVRTMYMVQPAALLGRMFLGRNSSAPTGVQPAHLNLYLAKIYQFDRALLRELDVLLDTQHQQRVDLDQLISRTTGLKNEVVKKANAINVKLKARESAASSLKRERLAMEEALTGLQAQALRLETVVTSLMNEGQAESPQPKREQVKQTLREPFSGVGLSRLKGKLTRPVRGKVLRRFGKYKPAEFDDFVLQKGIDFAADQGSMVKAIADGRVMHVGRLPGYGTVVILDHGARTYSLYGRLGDLKVERGDDVTASQELAKVGEADSKGRNFYFETRINGSPSDPDRIFGKKL